VEEGVERGPSSPQSKKKYSQKPKAATKTGKEEAPKKKKAQTLNRSHSEGELTETRESKDVKTKKKKRRLQVQEESRKLG